MSAAVRDVMTKNPVTCDVTTSVTETARLMRVHDIGDVLVLEGQTLRGIATDRDIVVRCLGAGADVSTSMIGDVCSAIAATIRVDASVDEAAQTMRDGAVRRLPVVDGDAVVGIVSLGDLAVEADPGSVLADISAAEPTS